MSYAGDVVYLRFNIARGRCLRLQCFLGKNLPLKAFKLRTLSATSLFTSSPAKAPHGQLALHETERERHLHRS